MSAQLSEAQRLAGQLADLADPHVALEEVLAELTPCELAHLWHDWPIWARPEQLIPNGPFRSFGFCAGIGTGKTRSITEWINAEVRAGRVGRIGFCAQNEAKTFEVQVEGKSGLIAVSPPWFKAKWIRKRIEWPNGATAHPYTPERPGAMRGPEHDVVWMSELIAWPTVTREEAFDTMEARSRIGAAKVLWDTSPKRRHPLLRMLFERQRIAPDLHIIRGGEMKDNVDNLTVEYVADQYRRHAGTRRGREELQGIYSDGDDGDGMFLERWFRWRPAPDSFRRRILTVDPAITSDKRWSDETGIADMGIAHDGHVYVNRNLTGKHRAEHWPGMVVDEYVARDCSLLWIETNRGGDTHVALLRVACDKRGLHLQLLEEDTDKPEPSRGTVYVRAVNTRGKKAVRAEGAANLMEAGGVSFVRGGHGLEQLRERLLAFDGTERTPDNEVDAFVHGCHELGELGIDRADGAAAIGEASQMMQALRAQFQPRSSMGLQALLGRGGGRRI